MNTNASPSRRSRTAVHVARRALPLIVLALVVGGAYLVWQRHDSTPKHVSAPAPQAPTPVHVSVVSEETVPIEPRSLGQTEASQVVEIRSRVNGYLQERSFVEGSSVTSGQKLFQIDPRPFQVELDQARARLTSSRAKQERAAQQLARFQELSQRRSATEGELEEWQKEERVAAADVELQQALVAYAELQLGYTSLESPIHGQIGRAIKDTGSYVDSGQNGLLAVVQRTDPMYVRYSVTEQETLRLKRQIREGHIAAPELTDTEIEITLADGTQYSHRGRINFVDVQVDQTTGTSVIRGEVPNPDGELKPGQFIYARPLGIRRLNAIRVPQSAVLQSPAGASVYVVNRQSLVEARPVTLGQWSGNTHWIVESGLKPGDRVVTDRLMMIRPGMPVSVLPIDASAAASTSPRGAGQGSSITQSEGAP